MPECPRCNQPVDLQAITCPFCRETLKAYGHPGIPLYRATDENALCQSCTYHADDTCNFPQRPHAKECTLYHNKLVASSTPNYSPRATTLIRLWLERNTVLLIIVGLLLFCLMLALLT